jgi:DNA replication protein DnaC
VVSRFLAERYERRSVIITSNVVFSEWDRIFKDPRDANCDEPPGNGRKRRFSPPC